MRNQKQANPPAAELPEWLTETPTHKYYLMVERDSEDERAGTWLQDIDLTREEYISLKQHLAALRGLVTEQAKPEPVEPLPADDSSLPPHQRNLRQAEARGKALSALSAEFEDLDGVEMYAVVGLIDLLQSRNSTEGVGSSWLARFVANVLIGVSGGHLAEVENHPAEALGKLEGYIRDFDRDITEARELAERYKGFEAIEEAIA